MSDLLSIGSSGLFAYGRALSTTADNIANSQTEGYARRDIRMAEAPAAGDEVFYRNNLRPGGVLVEGVTRSVNEWLVADARISGSEASRTTARLDWVSATERALDDGDAGVGSSLTAIFNAADTLANDPGNATLRQGFLQSVDDAASAFRRSAAGLESVSAGIGADAATSVDQLNTDLVALQRVNDGLNRAREGSTNQATLLDERDRLIDRISGEVSVTASFDARGATTLRLAGSAGTVLLDEATLHPLSVAQAADGTLSFMVAGGPAMLFSGRLAGLSEAASHVAGQRSALDALAGQFASQLNAAHQAGFDAGGNPGQPLLDPGSGAASIVALARTGTEVAAADATSANGNLLGLASLRGAGGVEAGWAAQVSAQAQATASARAQDAAATTRRDGAAEARAAVSAVDLDHEAAELLRFQQAYDASARVIQVARETIQSILNIF